MVANPFGKIIAQGIRVREDFPSSCVTCPLVNTSSKRSKYTRVGTARPRGHGKRGLGGGGLLEQVLTLICWMEWSRQQTTNRAAYTCKRLRLNARFALVDDEAMGIRSGEMSGYSSCEAFLMTWSIRRKWYFVPARFILITARKDIKTELIW